MIRRPPTSPPFLHDALPICRYRELAEALKSGQSASGCRVRFHHAPQTIEMEDSIRAIRSKPNASLNVGSLLADRKSTRLNSSHANISYDAFCLKKKRNNIQD